METGEPMKNITVSVDDAVYHRARVFAAKWDTSVSALVADLLEHMPLFTRLTREAEARAAAAAGADANPSMAKTSA